MKKVILILGFLALVACKKEETVIQNIPHQYEITYFVNCDSAFIQYTIIDKNFNHYISNWDTTFRCFGGWFYNIQVDGYSELVSTGVVIDSDTVDGCIGGSLCIMYDYVE